ncbi:hypothetical protein [Leucobacter sp. M11]|uniref:hypothetical protein n=1 Tax=Leucobacter sp. M11 TaxID=2993565 RepID=UPI002D7FB84C|nr:hypothetical protein [Leucobacter sp. M11]MEB4614122.1 hypothetical protein [Leucobacter sp. M11]
MVTAWLMAQFLALVLSLALGAQLSQPSGGTIALVALSLALLVPAAPIVFRVLRRALPGAVRPPARGVTRPHLAPRRAAGAPGTRGSVRARAPATADA